MRLARLMGHRTHGDAERHEDMGRGHFMGRGRKGMQGNVNMDVGFE
ncbi:hypothetical protein E2C01_067701 [Portunus trituberculatus]|uniref:Uncharacterized protein n=1 Tax=Portunus trituberculatus TaxID=210409 RepID=A0A5B7HUB9_PORTR|nr:hypothetical protein [Portunus trituberculatus]